MSLRQEEVIRLLPQNNYNVAQSMRQAGYTQAGSRSGTNYATIRKRLDKIYNPDTIKANIDKARALMLKEKDYSNYCRMLELQCKITGLTKEQGVQNTAIFSDDIVKRIQDKQAQSNVITPINETLKEPNTTQANI